MAEPHIYLGFDVGEKRVGVAWGDSIGRISQPVGAVHVDGSEATRINEIIATHAATDLVVGRPRNQSGEVTLQTKRVEAFVADILQPTGLPIHWQDESVTSVIAEKRLQERKRPYTKGDIDAEAATIVLQDYLELL